MAEKTARCTCPDDSKLLFLGHLKDCPEVAQPETWFAWCFSHGRLHGFGPDEEYPDGAWCDAFWTRLEGADEFAALEDRKARFGDACFEHELPRDKRVALVEEWSARHA